MFYRFMVDYKTDLEIVVEAKKEKILDLAKNKLSMDDENLIPYGHYKAKISEKGLLDLEKKKSGKLILVTAMTPTTAGEGKTTNIRWFD